MLTLQELLEMIARWSELDDAERETLNNGMAEFVAGCESQTDLDALEEALTQVTDEVLDEEGTPTDGGLEVLQWIAPTIAAVRERSTEVAEAIASEAAEAQALVDQIRGEQGGDEPEAGTEGADPEAGAEDGEGEGGEGDEPEAGAEVEQPEAVAAAGTQPRVTRVAARRPAAARPRARTEAAPAPLVAAAGVPNHGAGERFDSLAAAGQAIIETANAYRLGGPMARMDVPVLSQQLDQGAIPEERLLTRDARANDGKIFAVTNPQAIAAAGGFCASFPVTYEVPGVGVDDRPVKDALVQFMADRAGVVLQAPSSLEDVDGATTIWTRANDAEPGSDGPAEKPVLVVECGDEREAEVYGIPTALEFKNFSSRQHPERQAEIVRLAGVAAARVAEVQLLAEISSHCTEVSIGEGLSATRDLLAGIDRIIAARRYRYRLPISVPLRRLAPAWERDMIRADLARELPGSTAERLAVADAQIDEFWRVRNVTNTYILDGESGQTFGVQGDGPAIGWPGTIVSYLFQEGAFLYLNGGNFNLGVVRDTEMAKANKFQVWSEIVEGVAFNGVWADRITHDVCPSGASSATVDFDPCAFGS